MPLLSIDLQDGFDDDQVIVTIDGDVVRRLEHVTTRLLLGYAEKVRLEIPSARCTLGVSLPRRDLSADVEIAATAHVGARIDSGRLVLSVRDQPFGYA